MQMLDRDGLRLAVDDVGSGEPPLLFVHPWSGDHTFFEPQVAYFSRRHRVVSVDLRGHGASDAPLGDYSMETFAGDLAWIVRTLDLDRPVVVGHSKGGVIALALGALHPESVRALVLLDAPLLPSAPLLAAVPGLQQGMESPAYREVTRQFQGQFVGFAEEPARRESILDVLVSGPQHVKASSLRQVFESDHAAWAAAYKSPVLYVGSGGGFADLERLVKLCPQLQVSETSGSGHFHQLEVPDQVNAAIEGFLASLR